MAAMTRADLLRAAFAVRDLQALALYAAALVTLVALSSPTLATLGAIALGLVAWVLSEYAFHRFLLHLPLVRYRPIRQVQKRIHHKHHRVPDDPRYLFVPWWASPGLLALGGGLCTLVVGRAAFIPCTLGYALALLVYEVTHFTAHVPYRPRTRWFAFMKRHHLLHHYKNERYWFGVTTPLGDLLARTWPPPDRVPKSKTARDLTGPADAA